MFKILTRLQLRRSRAKRGRIRPARRLQCEPLEQRTLLTTFFVDNSPSSGSELPGDNFFSEVQEAIDAANAGDRILLKSGIFQPFVVDKDRLTIRPASPTAKPVIDGNLNEGDENTVEVRANHVQIVGLTLRNASGTSNFWILGPGASVGHGIYVYGSEGTRLRENTLRDNESRGIFLESSQQTLVQSNKFQRNGVGLIYSNNNRVLDNSMIFSAENNLRIGRAGDGIFSHASDNNLFARNTINNAYVGIELVASSENKVIANSISNSWNGLRVDGGITQATQDLGSDRNSIVDNKVLNSTQVGITSYSSDHNMFRGNLSRGTGGVGFIVSGAVGSKFYDNVAIENGFDTGSNIESGFYFGAVDQIVVSGNHSFRNSQTGFEFYAVTNSVVADNVASSNATDGMKVRRNSTNNVLRNNTSSYNRQNGIRVEESDNNVLANNLAVANAENGFDIGRDSNRNTLSRNRAIRSGIDGFFISRSSDENRLIENVAISSRSFGFSIFLSNGGTFIRNVAQASGDVGFRVETANSNRFRENVALRNGADGFEIIEENFGNSFVANHATRNGRWGFSIDILMPDVNDYRDNVCTNNLSGSDNHGGAVC